MMWPTRPDGWRISCGADPAGYDLTMHAHGDFTQVVVRAGDTSDDAKRLVGTSTMLTAEEMSPTVRDDGGMTIVAGEFHGHAAQVGTWIGPDGLHLDESDPAPEPADSGPVRYVVCRTLRFGNEHQGLVRVGAESVSLSSDRVEELGQAVLSDLLCGVDGESAVAARFGSEPAGYRTIVGRFPKEHDGQRHGTFLMVLTEAMRQIRVVGECQSYRQECSYDASALVAAGLDDVWFGDEAEMIVRRTARELMGGAPALYSISDQQTGYRGAYDVNTRQEDPELMLTAAEQFIASMLGRLVDRRRGADADYAWASAGPVVWPHLTRMADEAASAWREEGELCAELAERGLLEDPFAYDSDVDSWIFREGIIYNDLIHSTVLW